jgi:hypothetical protein
MRGQSHPKVLHFVSNFRMGHPRSVVRGGKGQSQIEAALEAAPGIVGELLGRAFEIPP